MSAFFQDIWHDLREKHLWPVALLLGVGLIAVPVLLFKPAKDAGEAAAAPTEVSPEAKAMLALARRAENPSSDLGVFEPKDPFQAPADAVDAPSAATAGVPGATSAPGGAATDAGTGGGASGSDTGAAAASGATVTTKSRSRRAVTRKTYTWVADLRFGERGKVKSRKGVKALTLLPSSRNPLLVFLGVTDDFSRAVFLVESGLSQEGEGRCKPSRRYCSFLYLRTADSGDDHYFATPDGKQYVLHLSGIRRTEVRKRKKRARQSAMRTSAAGAGPGAIFESPVFAREQR